jgi:hypothetical protein
MRDRRVAQSSYRRKLTSPRATPADAYDARPRAVPGDRSAGTHDRVRTDRIDATGLVTLRHNGTGRARAGTRVLLLVQDLEIRVINAATGELLRELTLNPDRDYQPIGKPAGWPQKNFAGRRRPLYVRGCRVSGSVRSTDEHGPAHGRARKRPRTGPAGAVTQTVPTRIPALTCHFRVPLAAVISVFTGFALGPGVLGAASGDEVANAGISGTRAGHEATESVG